MPTKRRQSAAVRNRAGGGRDQGGKLIHHGVERIALRQRPPAARQSGPQLLVREHGPDRGRETGDVQDIDEQRARLAPDRKRLPQDVEIVGNDRDAGMCRLHRREAKRSASDGNTKTSSEPRKSATCADESSPTK